MTTTGTMPRRAENRGRVVCVGGLKRPHLKVLADFDRGPGSSFDVRVADGVRFWYTGDGTQPNVYLVCPAGHGTARVDLVVLWRDMRSTQHKVSVRVLGA